MINHESPWYKPLRQRPLGIAIAQYAEIGVARRRVLRAIEDTKRIPEDARNRPGYQAKPYVHYGHGE